ncbi:sirohydrochlorin chelatase [Mycobacterium sp. NBC_00419]|uniref:sirohydrochlorin chelatase n=1 Tax=Mycobacterium sp. NBC_00419 TaxID=2975989 RepID=UPI002E21E78C
MNPTLVLVAHGTRRPEGVQVISEIAADLAGRVGPVLTAFVDVLGPNPRELLATVAGPVTVVPAFLASGYHVNTDLPARVRESGHPAARITPALGPDPVIAEVMLARLLGMGWVPGDPVVMAAAGSSDPVAHRDLSAAATLLADLVGEVHLAFVATGEPKVNDVVGSLARSGRRVFVASYLLAPGVFHTRLLDCGAHAVTAPLGADRRLVDLLAGRFADVASMSCR